MVGRESCACSCRIWPNQCWCIPSAVDSFSSTHPLHTHEPKAIARQPQNPTLESRETDNTGANTALMESFVETPLYKEYCAGKHTHEAKINSSFVNLPYTIYLLASTNLNCDNVEWELDVSSVLLSTRRHWTVDWSIVVAIAVLLLKPRLVSKGNKSFVNATVPRNVWHGS